MVQIIDLFRSEIWVELLIALLAAAFVVTYVIEALKARDVIQPGQAGHWNEGLSSLIGGVTFVLTWMKMEGRIGDASQAAQLVAPGLAFIIVTILTSKTWYELLKWVRGVKPFFKPATPATQVNVGMGSPSSTEKTTEGRTPAVGQMIDDLVHDRPASGANQPYGRAGDPLRSIGSSGAIRRTEQQKPPSRGQPGARLSHRLAG